MHRQWPAWWARRPGRIRGRIAAFACRPLTRSRWTVALCGHIWRRTRLLEGEGGEWFMPVCTSCRGPGPAGFACLWAAVVVAHLASLWGAEAAHFQLEFPRPACRERKLTHVYPSTAQPRDRIAGTASRSRRRMQHGRQRHHDHPLMIDVGVDDNSSELLLGTLTSRVLHPNTHPFPFLLFTPKFGRCSAFQSRRELKMGRCEAFCLREAEVFVTRRRD